ncbi:MAG: PAS domain-containing protein [Acidobacteria bacterium]|nr:PAS domain-containing protein [Acidobacteriota bacterium]
MWSLRTKSRIIILALMAVAVVAIGAVNLREQHRYQLPDDGVFWVESANRVVAATVAAPSSAAIAGLKPGDTLVSIGGGPIRKSLDVARQVFRSGVGAQVPYVVLRDGQAVTLNVQLAASARPPVHAALQLVGLLYLIIGGFVLLRRFTASRATHFYLFCLASFVLFVFSYTGKLNNFDWTVYWISAAAMLLQPALFAHFCLAYPGAESERSVAVRSFNRKLILFVIYGSAAILGALHVSIALGALRFSASLAELRWIIDRLEIGYLIGMFLLGIGLLVRAWRSTRSLYMRKQMAWVLAGSIIAVAPFAIMYGIPYLLGVVPGPWMNLSAFSLVVLPLAFGYAIIRYRLLDVDVVLQRGAAYTLATAALVGAYFGVAALAGILFGSSFPGGGTIGVICAVVATGVLFQPLQQWIQGRLERRFLPQRYDYRQALLDFGRELSTETDLDRMIRSLFDQLARTLNVKQAAVFVPRGNGSEGFVLRGSAGLDRNALMDTSRRDFGFLRLLSQHASWRHGDYLFFQGTGDDLDRSIERAGIQDAAWKAAIADAGLHYYFPCRARGKVVAVLGLGKTAEGEFLWEEDAALVETLAGYLAIAVENVTLLESLVAKATQFERLQEFSENILESINVGLIAVDLEDRVEAVNTPLKLMAPIRIQGHFNDPNEDLHGKRLGDVLPLDLAEQLDRLRDDGGIHNIYRYRVKNRQGEDRVLNIAVAPLLSKNCDWIGRLIIFDDVTDRVGLEAQLTQAEKLSSIGLLAAGVAHEVNTPLTVISTQAQMMAKQLPPGDKNQKMMEKIISQTFRASQIVNSLLNFSRTKGSAFAPVDINKIVSETLLLLDHQFKAARIQVESSLDPSLPTVSGNSDKLQQVFLNMFLNAKDAMPDGGCLRVSTWAVNAHIEIEISDNGVGIPPEHLQRIYDPFFTTKASGRGTGLGLAVTYGIVHEHAGKIHVESLPGLGTRFRLEFPAMAKEVHA